MENGATLNELNNSPENNQSKPLSKTAQKKLLKQQRIDAKKAEKKALLIEQKQREGERKLKEWQQKLAGLTEEERRKFVDSRKEWKKKRMEKKSEEREQKIQRLIQAKKAGQNIVLDLEFTHLMTHSEIHSLVQQIMYCYGLNGRCNHPAHLWLTGCQGEIETQLQRVPGSEKWIIEEKIQSYIQVFSDQKENLVYLTADSKTELHELDPTKIYIVGGLVDKIILKGVTMMKAEQQGIHTAKLPIATYMKMSSSQVLTVNQVIEILLKFLETKDWKASFFQVIPQRKRYGSEADSENFKEVGEEVCGKNEEYERKMKCIEVLSHA